MCEDNAMVSIRTNRAKDEEAPPQAYHRQAIRRIYGQIFALLNEAHQIAIVESDWKAASSLAYQLSSYAERLGEEMRG